MKTKGLNSAVEHQLNRTRANRGGRPRRAIDADAIVRLREEGLSWRAVSQKLGLGYGTARRTCLQRAKTPQGEPKPLGVAITATPEPLQMPSVSEPRVYGFVVRRRRKPWLCRGYCGEELASWT